jgi:photosystem II stability/assembly factor-like uncharacterized protein
MKRLFWTVSLVLFGQILLHATAFAQLSPTEGEREWRAGEEMRRHAITRQQEAHASPDDMLDQWRAEHQGAKGVSTQSSTIQYRWEYLGPKNQSGHVQTIQSIPGSAEIIVGASGGGVWKLGKDSVWKVKTDTAFPSLKMSASAIAPSKASVIAMGTREGFVYLSTDSGNTWRVTQHAPGANVVSLAFHPSNPSMLYAATDDGLKLSIDQGATWKNLAPGRARSVLIDAQNPLIIYYGQMDWTWPNSTESVMKSTDGGKTFAKVFSQPQGYWSDVLLMMCKAHPEVLWLGTDSARVYFRTGDGGANWNQCTTAPYADSYYNGFWCCAADPLDPFTAFAGGPGLFRTKDGGNTWVRIDKNVHADFHTLAFPGGKRAVLGCDGGVYVTEDYTLNIPVWRYQGAGLITLEAYNVAATPTGDDTIVTGNQDNGYAKYTNDPKNWKIIGGDGFVTIYDPNEPLQFYHEYTDMNLHRADDGFNWWSTKVMNGLSTTADFYTGIVNEPVDWYGQAVAIDPSTPHTLYCGTDTLFRTNNSGDLWTPVANRRFSRGSFISSICVAPNDPQTVYVGSNDGLLSSTHDGGATWDTATLAQFGKQTGRIYSIAVDPTDGKKAYISMQVGGGGTPLYRTSDGGHSWTPIVTGLTNVSTAKILVNPNHPERLYIATTTGVFTSDDFGTNWAPLQGLPTVQVIDLAWQNLGGEQCLLLGTYGRGIIRGHVQHSISTVDLIDFGKVHVGRSKDSIVKAIITNTGETALTIKSFTTSDPSFSIVSSLGPVTIPTSALYAMTLRVTPSTAKSYSATLQASFSDGTTGTISQLKALSSQLTLLAPAKIAFESHYDTTIALTAAGFSSTTDTLRLLSMRVDGFDSASFKLLSETTGFITSSRPYQLHLKFSYLHSEQSGANLIVKTDGSPVIDTVLLRLFPQDGGAVAEVAHLAGVTVAFSPDPISTSSTLTIKAGETNIGKRFTISIYDAAGRYIEEAGSGIFAAKMQMPLLVNNLASGSYQLVLASGNRMMTQRFVVSK